MQIYCQTHSQYHICVYCIYAEYISNLKRFILYIINLYLRPSPKSLCPHATENTKSTKIQCTAILKKALWPIQNQPMSIDFETYPWKRFFWRFSLIIIYDGLSFGEPAFKTLPKLSAHNMFIWWYLVNNAISLMLE